MSIVRACSCTISCNRTVVQSKSENSEFVLGLYAACLRSNICSAADLCLDTACLCFDRSALNTACLYDNRSGFLTAESADLDDAVVGEVALSMACVPCVFWWDSAGLRGIFDRVCAMFFLGTLYNPL